MPTFTFVPKLAFSAQSVFFPYSFRLERSIFIFSLRRPATLVAVPNSFTHVPHIE